MDENIVNEELDSEGDEAYNEMVERNLEGNDAGRAFADRHILQKMNLFIDEYRKNGYSEDFIRGFVDGINDVTGGVIYLENEEAAEESEEAGEAVEEELQHEHS